MAALVLGAVTWFALVVLLKVALVSFGLVVALLLAALLEPGAGLLRRLGLPPAWQRSSASSCCWACPSASGSCCTAG